MMNRYNLCAFCEKATLPYLRSTSYMPYGGQCNFRICKLCDEEIDGVAEEAFEEFDWVEEQDPRIPAASFASRPGSVQFGLLFSFQHMCVEKLQRFYGLHEFAHLGFSKWKCDDGYPLDIWEQIDSICWEYPLRSIMFQMVATLGVAVHQNMTDCRPIYIMSMLKGKELDKERKADMSKNTIYSDNLSDFMLDLHDMATTSGSRFCSDDNFRQVISTHSLSLSGKHLSISQWGCMPRNSSPVVTALHNQQIQLMNERVILLQFMEAHYKRVPGLGSKHQDAVNVMGHLRSNFDRIVARLEPLRAG